MYEINSLNKKGSSITCYNYLLLCFFIYQTPHAAHIHLPNIIISRALMLKNKETLGSKDRLLLTHSLTH